MNFLEGLKFSATMSKTKNQSLRILVFINYLRNKQYFWGVSLFLFNHYYIVVNNGKPYKESIFLKLMIKMKASILNFANKNGKTVYNPTVPFEFNGKNYMGVRMESLESELDSQTSFAYEKDKKSNLWVVDNSIKSLPLQDPTHVEINGETFILGVKVWQVGRDMRWRQEIYRGDSIKDLEYFTSGPEGMKDIRFVDLDYGIGVFTRPQGKIGGRGKIGYLEVGSIDELKTFAEDDWYNGAKIIEDLFDDNLWGGVNQAIKLSGGEIGVIGHIAHQTINGEIKLEKHYYGMAFRFNPKTRTHSGLKIIDKREGFPHSPSKRTPKLDDIIFPAGIDNKNNLYCGLSDFCIGKKKIGNPF